MKLSRTVDNLRFMENELKREHGKNQSMRLWLESERLKMQ